MDGERRFADTERMVQALYDHFRLGDRVGGDSGGSGGDGRGRNDTSEGKGAKGAESRNGG